MRSAWLVLLAACGGSSCPTVDEVMKNNTAAESHWEADVIVKRCRDDHWSDTVTRCLRAAETYDAEEPCFAQLTPEQAYKLKSVFESGEAPVDQIDAMEKRVSDDTFGKDLAALGLDQLAARAPECADYRAAIETTRKALLACTKDNSLETYGVQQVTKLHLHELVTLSGPQLAAGCAKAAADLRHGGTCD